MSEEPIYDAPDTQLARRVAAPERLAETQDILDRTDALAARKRQQVEQSRTQLLEKTSRTQDEHSAVLAEHGAMLTSAARTTPPAEWHPGPPRFWQRPANRLLVITPCCIEGRARHTRRPLTARPRRPARRDGSDQHSGRGHRCARAPARLRVFAARLGEARYLLGGISGARIPIHHV
ncbi:hypothetical protein ADK75_06375 [Streptomyces virginiae]|uniref:Uncharacterized protein n=1 Tax=Streptomyces virginiae TaxID=1961 RepID=A0A0L8N2C6_STRVG|nr:hypothetical protein ADK75_06375 [Streptomyces virginiae]